MKINSGWVSVSSLALLLAACGPRVSVGEMGEAGAPGDDAGAGGSSAGAPSGGAPSAGAGGSAGNVAECADDVRTPLTLPTPTCPATPPADGEPCSLPETSTCVWQWDSAEHDGSPGFDAFACLTTLSGDSQVWLQKSAQAYANPSPDSQQCPRTAPSDGASCSVPAGLGCYYPALDCKCGTGAAWSCEVKGGPAVLVGQLPVAMHPLCAPAAVDESKQVQDLSDAEALAWCQWYAQAGERVYPHVNPNDPPDEVTEYGSSWGYPFGQPLCIPELPPELCVKNLRTQPCTATLQELGSCLETIRAGRGGWVGKGCGPLLGNPTCSRIIVQQRESADMCPVPIQ